jgi:predicted nucleic acid-binding protein
VTYYVDSSVLVRIIAGQEQLLSGWEDIAGPLSSVLIEIEVPRAIERLRVAGDLSEDAAIDAAARGKDALRAFRLLELEPAIRMRAGGPFALPLRSLDAIHLASALLWQEAHPNEELVMATHDERVARASRAHGLRVVGWP